MCLLSSQIGYVSKTMHELYAIELCNYFIGWFSITFGMFLTIPNVLKLFNDKNLVLVLNLFLKSKITLYIESRRRNIPNIINIHINNALTVVNYVNLFKKAK